jgi:hypothetical protein
MDVTLFVHMPDGKMPNKGELLYQDTRQAVNLDNVNHAEIHHMEIWGSIGGDLTKNGRFYATVKDCTLYYAGGAMQGPNGRTGKKSSRWTGAVAFVADKDRAYREVIITDCTIRKSLGGGILIRRCHSGRAAGNTITNFVCGNAPWPGAFYGTLANNFIVEKNLCDTSGHRGIHTKGQWGISGIWFDGNSNRDIIRYNWVRNVNGSYYNCESSDNGEWYYNIGSHGARFGYKLGGGREAHGNRILNNTLIHTQSVIDETGRRRTGGGILLYDQDQGKTVVKNNIIHTSTGYYIYVHPEFGGAGLTIDYNNYSGLPKSRWHWKGRDYFVFSSWQIAGNNGNDMHGPGVANPFFSSISERGVELLPQSPCIDVGGDVGLRTDFRGTTVPQGKGIEIGSNEYLQAP